MVRLKVKGGSTIRTRQEVNASVFWITWDFPFSLMRCILKASALSKRFLYCCDKRVCFFESDTLGRGQGFGSLVGEDGVVFAEVFLERVEEDMVQC